MVALSQQSTPGVSDGDDDAGMHVGHLPCPPSDDERDLYLGPQRRWVPAASTVGAGLTTMSLLFLIGNRAWALPLLVPVGVGVLGGVLSLVSSSRTRRDTLATHRGTVRGWWPARVPSVDVFLPSAGEPMRVLRNTYRHVAELDWPAPLTVYVLDDSVRAEVRDLAAEYGFRYLTRPDPGYLKKAGNLRFGYENSGGDLIAIFDADFVPRSDFLHELVPYLDAADVGIVQSPQFFDLDRRMGWIEKAAGSTQVLFYKWVQPSRDRSDAAICVGTCAVYRRLALDAAGGFAQIGHSEDVHTGVNLMRAGYRVRYVPTVVAKGLCPDELARFVTQQYRWCTGSMSLLFSRGFHRTRLSAMQRVSFWSGFVYYIHTAVSVFVTSLPPILMAVLAPAAVRPANYVFVLLALVMRLSLVPILTLERDSFVSLSRIQTAYGFAHAVALFDVVRGRTDSWQATGATVRSATAKRVITLARIWLVGTQALLWGSLLWRAPDYGWLNYAVMAGFAALNLVTIYPLAFGGNRLLQALRPLIRRRVLIGSAS
jgi:cellulose synthase (UDP-forming)